MRLVVIFGPPSVGKMAVGRALASISDFRLLHNHAVLEPLLDVFDYGTPPFNRLLGEFRRRVISEAAGAGVDLVLTYVWAFALDEDAREVGDYVRPYVEAGADVSFVELWSDLETRLSRNRTELRLLEKRSKRDVEWSDANVRELEQYVMNTEPDGHAPQTPGDRLLAQHRHLRLDNTDVSPGDAAAQILAWLDS